MTIHTALKTPVVLPFARFASEEAQSDKVRVVTYTPSLGSRFGFPVQAEQVFQLGQLLPDLSRKDNTLTFPSAGHLIEYGTNLIKDK